MNRVRHRFGAAISISREASDGDLPHSAVVRLDMRFALGSTAHLRCSLLLILSASTGCAHAVPLPPLSSTASVLQKSARADTVVVRPVPPRAMVPPARIRIRCANTISADHPPLYVIDGVPIGLRSDGTIDRALGRIDPRSIVFIQVLKDATAVTRFGPGAHQGVVIITTTKAKTRSP
jgi:hypothetical protein